MYPQSISHCYGTPQYQTFESLSFFPLQQNGQLSFVPEDYGKEKPPPVKKTRNHAHSSTPKHSRNVSPDDPPEDATCEYCKMVGPRNQFLPPSRRFCSLSCCKRYSAEKRYYPYGRDEEGIAKAIREGLVNPKSKSVRQASSKQVRVGHCVCVCTCFLRTRGEY